MISKRGLFFCVADSNVCYAFLMWLKNKDFKFEDILYLNCFLEKINILSPFRFFNTYISKEDNLKRS